MNFNRLYVIILLGEVIVELCCRLFVTCKSNYIKLEWKYIIKNVLNGIID